MPIPRPFSTLVSCITIYRHGHISIPSYDNRQCTCIFSFDDQITTLLGMNWQHFFIRLLLLSLRQCLFVAFIMNAPGYILMRLKYQT
jgi:hypothetical protein